ncbi:hypothetical protein S1OALGB6SA_1892 [Olavius algarvensis spirochete endosymbiont]|nr:hypothetical protein JY97_14525 [Alkalispirochaeta odontotermitis]CAD7842158.1 MAG: hypothetical protein [Olavius algarvensis spirochete endosymbiont]VDB00802.1 hypothetical protein S1OALGB6SA_1892 [Olavius algarvensis spirochete endosymbiont]
MRFPKEGFLKIASPKRTKIDSTRKVALIRKGNELFNSGDVDSAKKIFLACGYTDGIIRVGDNCYKNADYWEAYRLYILAPAPDRVDHLIKKMAQVIQDWLHG